MQHDDGAVIYTLSDELAPFSMPLSGTVLPLNDTEKESIWFAAAVATDERDKERRDEQKRICCDSAMYRTGLDQAVTTCA